MKNKITLCFFIDALGWRILSEHPEFLSNHSLNKKKLRTILGYSSACDPSIISGLKPSEHLHWSSFYYSPESCDYSWVKYLSFFPYFVTKRQRIRHYISTLIKKVQGYTGYFQIYQVPFKYLPYFGYAEKYSIWTPKGLNRGRTIFTELQEKNISYYVGDQDADVIQVEKVKEGIKNKSINFAYILFGKLDAVMHMNGTRHPKVKETLDEIEQGIDSTIRLAKEHYDDVDYFLFSDHGMHDVTDVHNLQEKISKLELTYGKDYFAFYDSTMARFWYLNENARTMIIDELASYDFGRVLPADELKSEGVYFPDHQYGETIFLMKPGSLIIPSYMGLKPIPGMHGYDPAEKDSCAMIATNCEIPEELKSIEQIYSLLKSSIQSDRYSPGECQEQKV